MRWPIGSDSPTRRASTSPRSRHGTEPHFSTGSGASSPINLPWRHGTASGWTRTGGCSLLPGSCGWVRVYHAVEEKPEPVVVIVAVGIKVRERITIGGKDVGPARFDGGRFDEARGTFERVATSDELAEFLNLPAYDLLVAGEVRGDRMRQET